MGFEKIDEERDILASYALSPEYLAYRGILFGSSSNVNGLIDDEAFRQMRRDVRADKYGTYERDRFQQPWGLNDGEMARVRGHAITSLMVEVQAAHNG